MTDERDNEGQDDDAALWTESVRDVKPIKRERKSESPSVQSPEKKSQNTSPIQVRMKSRPSKEQYGGIGLDKRTAERLRKGQMPIEARLDLHGLNQGQAHEALNRFVVGAQASGKRCVLVITGKGSGTDGKRCPVSSGQGVLKRKVPEWLDEAPLGPLVLKTHPARPQHGGDGALYVLLRRKR